MILLITVGTSPDPILFSVQALRQELHPQPVEVVFICSVHPCPTPTLDQVVGEGFPCNHFLPGGLKERGANLLVQLDITDFNPDRQLIKIPDPDDLADIYKQISDYIFRLRKSGYQGRIRGDYTGATKSMSVALAMACVHMGVEVGLVGGARDNPEKIDQSESTRLMDIAPLHVKYRLRLQLQHVLSLHGYGEAGQLIGRFLESYDQSMTPEDSSAVRDLQAVISVLDTWDQFRWQDAMNRSKETLLQRQCPALMDWWKRVMRARQWSAQPDGTVRGERFPGVTGYELVQDLILNAERRGMRGLYDDAVARLYRALELLAQTYVLHELRLNPVGRDYRRANPHVPLHAYLDSQQRIIHGPHGRGVGNLYSWISDYENRNGIDGLGRIYAEQQRNFSGLMTARNRSLLAHGFNPLSNDRWELLQRTITSFVDLVLKQSAIAQGAVPQQLPGCDLLELPEYRGLFGTPPVPPSDG